MKEAIDESPVKDIACASGIHGIYFEPLNVEEFSINQSDNAFVTQSGAEKSRGVFLKFEKSLFLI